MNYREKNKRKQKESIVFFGDGLTEFYYIKHFKEINGIKEINFFIQKSNFNKSLSLDKIKKKLKDCAGNGVKVLYITDVENNQNKIANIKKLNNKNILTILNNPSIEYWFLLHYEDTNRNFTADELKRYIDRYIDNYQTTENFLENEQWVRKLNDTLKDAYNRSKKYTDKNSSFTEFSKFIDLINKNGLLKI